MEKGMEESYIKDLANRDGPAHALAFREGSEALVSGCVQAGLLSLEMGNTGVPTRCVSSEGNIVGGAFREPSSDPAGSENLCMCVISSC
jgi:hypothetical protein